jgi:hypothetical protein
MFMTVFCHETLGILSNLEFFLKADFYKKLSNNSSDKTV